MRRLMVGLLVGVMGILTGCSGATQTPSTGHSAMSGMTDPSPQSAVRQLGPTDFAAQAADRLTINVHVPDEGALPDTDLTIPYDQISARRDELPSDKNSRLAIYCMTGSMSAVAGTSLMDLGYTDIIELRGGMQAWQAAGLELINPR